MSENKFSGNVTDAVKTHSINCKNAINEEIRNALASPGEFNVPPLNRQIPLFDEISDPLELFVEKFEAAGGKCVVFELDHSRMRDPNYAFAKLNDIYSYVNLEIELGHYNSVLNGSPKLTTVLSKYEVPFVNSVPTGTYADAAIFYAEYLIARTGTIAFSQHNDLMLYPSVRNLASNLIVLASNGGLVKDLQDVLRQSTQRIQEDNRPEEVELKTDMLELFRPSGIEKEQATPANPFITLVLLVER